MDVKHLSENCNFTVMEGAIATVKVSVEKLVPRGGQNKLI